MRARVTFRVILGVTLFLLAGCVNSQRRYSPNQTASGTPLGGLTGNTGSGTPSNSSTPGTPVISAVNVAPASNTPSGNSTQPLQTTIAFDSVNSNTALNTLCSIPSPGSQGNCFCVFNWTSSTQISRSIKTPLTSVQPYFVACNAPDPSVYATEIPNGTTIRVSVTGSGTNGSSGFTTQPFSYIKNASGGGSNFQDNAGRTFNDILHYACYQTSSRGTSIQNYINIHTNPNTATNTTDTLYEPFATRFCVSSSSGAVQTSDSCPNAQAAEYSAQSYYYNFYIKSGEGGINYFNSDFVCPLVQENLDKTNIPGVWPQDATYALSATSSGTFNVGVEANSKISGGSDPNAVSSSCSSGTSSNTPNGNNGNNNGSSSSGGGSSVITSCLGFAALPNADSTCPTITDSSGNTKLTYRLRKYVALYPRFFNTDGRTFPNRAQGVDTIYVLDRPVQGSSDPLKPYTMRGPKPCPFAFFDKKGLIGGTPGYVATSNLSWRGFNVDGIEFPNTDAGNPLNRNSLSCATAFPVLNASRSSFNIKTIDKNSHVYVRPFEPFTPHYEEDTDFQACAPQATNFKDPPLHFTKAPNVGGGNVSWCAESYPTQNPFIDKLDPTGNKGVIPFTSHVLRNAVGAPCNATRFSFPINYSYANGGPATHPNRTWEGERSFMGNTCDRTVAKPPTEITWTGFPLLAPAIDVEVAMRTDFSYQCTLTYDKNQGKTNTSTPSGGCCDSSTSGGTVKVITGADTTAPEAHLEPGVPCNPPAY